MVIPAALVDQRLIFTSETGILIAKWTLSTCTMNDVNFARALAAAPQIFRGQPSRLEHLSDAPPTTKYTLLRITRMPCSCLSASPPRSGTVYLAKRVVTGMRYSV